MSAPEHKHGELRAVIEAALGSAGWQRLPFDDTTAELMAGAVCAVLAACSGVRDSRPG